MRGSSRLDKHMEDLEANRAMVARVEHCQAENSELNGWEDEFLESVLDWLTGGRKLSDSQLETLEKIEYKVEWGIKAYWEEYGNADR